MNDASRSSNRHVPTGLYLRTRFFSASAPLWLKASRLESAVLRDEIEQLKIDRPIYVAGVPRAGTTIVTEMLARHTDVTSHRYSDFPNVYTPYWRNWLAERSRRRPAKAVERAHRDRIMISTESPEAVEEVIWMHYFDHLHNPSTNQVLGPGTTNPGFEHYYRDHIRKLLLVRGRTRYLAKGNYNATRLGYIRQLFPDARFIVPVRHPVNQVASLVKQDRLFERANTEDSRVERQLGLSGHFEFGPGRQPVCIGDGKHARMINEHWQASRRVAGWALYWHSIYSHVLDTLEQDSELASAVFLLRYEDLCREPAPVLSRLFEHARLDAAGADPLVAEYADRISEPDYYRADFSAAELKQISEICHLTAGRLGYNLEPETDQ